MSLATQPHVETAARPRFPVATATVVAVNTAFFAATILDPGARRSLFASLAHFRYLVWEGEWWRLLTGTVLHEGPVHFLLNMVVLVLFGRIVEPAIGPCRFVAVYAGAGLGGALLFQAASVAHRGVGASGAVYGVVGAFFRLWWIAASYRGGSGGRLAIILVFAAVLALDQLVALGLQSAGLGIGVSAHAGGLLTGLLLAYALRAGESAGPAAATRGHAVRWPALALFALAAAQLAVYGGFFTWHDPAWHAHRKQRAVEQLLDGGEPERAAKAWQETGTDGRLDRVLGYKVCDGLLALGRRDLALPVLDLLIADVEAEIAATKLSVELGNEAAWYAAVKGEGLGIAFERVDGAVKFLEANEDRGWFGDWQDPVELAMCLNTRGWIALRLGSEVRGLRDLARAAELDPSGANQLYFALALWQAGDARRAREVARQAEGAGGLSRHERRLLEDLREDAGGW